MSALVRGINKETPSREFFYPSFILNNSLCQHYDYEFELFSLSKFTSYAMSSGGSFLDEHIFWMTITLNCIQFYVKVPKTGGHFFVTVGLKNSQLVMTFFGKVPSC
jgi:hypothetical protein